MEVDIKEGSQTIYNQAQLQMFRLHEIMREINLCWTNLTGITNGIPNTQILLDNLITYYLEISSVFTDKEKKDVDGKIEEVEKFLITRPLYKINISSGMGGQIRNTSIDFFVYNQTKKDLRDLQTLIFEYANSHGLLNPAKADPKRAVLH